MRSSEVIAARLCFSEELKRQVESQRAAKAENVRRIKEFQQIIEENVSKPFPCRGEGVRSG